MIRLVAFDHVARDTRATDTLLGFAMCTYMGTALTALPVYRAHDRRLIVAWPVLRYDPPLAYSTQLRVACKIKRHIRRLERGL